MNTQPQNLDLWIDRYAEMLGCDPDPGKVAVAIYFLLGERDRLIKAIPRHREHAAKAAIEERDAT